jgi:D-arabinan exo alpha-(1,3)/(1,5)-arabinofuranosidase (non-reducing end)
VRLCFLMLVLTFNPTLSATLSSTGGINDLPDLVPGRTLAENALWIENPLSRQFASSKRVVVAEIEGPAVITMVHFAMPAALKLNRDLLLRAYWDHESSPSVDCPLVDFFCDPAGLRGEVNTALVNKRRGFNAYFPMPFRKSARIELLYDGSLEPGEKLWKAMPCYSYVMYRKLEKIPENVGYFHAHWRQEALLLGKRDYVALEAKGRGKFVGWNVTIRRPGRAGYPVDENEKFYIDGEESASVEFQGLEDSFGFSWGFPPTESMFPLTGYFPFLKGACGYRFFLNDAISFERSLRVTIGFGEHENEMFRRQFSKPGSTLQLSSVVYWYQTEPHVAYAEMPGAAERAPAPDVPFWPDKEKLPSLQDLKKRRVRFYMLCGRPQKEIIYAEPGFDARAESGYTWDGWNLPVYYCRADDKELRIQLTVPKGARGLLRLYVIDPDNFHGGRKETITVAGKSLGEFHDFQDGRWLECAMSPEQTADGKIVIRVRNARQGANAVLSIIEWVGSG